MVLEETGVKVGIFKGVSTNGFVLWELGELFSNFNDFVFVFSLLGYGLKK
jgi:hypothetical protein